MNLEFDVWQRGLLILCTEFSQGISQRTCPTASLIFSIAQRAGSPLTIPNVGIHTACAQFCYV